MPTRTLVVLALCLSTANVAHAGRFDRLMLGAKAKVDLLRRKFFGRPQPGEPLGVTHAADPVELGRSTAKLTTRQFKIGKGGRIVATRTIFQAFSPHGKVVVEAADDQDDELTRRPMTSMMFEGKQQERIALGKIDLGLGAPSVKIEHPGVAFGGHRINRLGTLGGHRVDHLDGSMLYTRMQISVADARGLLARLGP